MAQYNPPSYFSFDVERSGLPKAPGVDPLVPAPNPVRGTGPDKVLAFVEWAIVHQIEFNDSNIIHFVASIAGLLGHPNTDKLIQDSFADARKLIDAIQHPAMFTGETAIQPIFQKQDSVNAFMKSLQDDVAGLTSRTDLLVLKASLRPQYMLTKLYFTPLLSAHIEQAIEKIRRFVKQGTWSNPQIYSYVLNDPEYQPKFARLVACLIQQTERARVVSSRRHQLKYQDEQVADALAPFMNLDIDVLIVGYSYGPSAQPEEEASLRKSEVKSEFGSV